MKYIIEGGFNTGLKVLKGNDIVYYCVQNFYNARDDDKCSFSSGLVFEKSEEKRVGQKTKWKTLTRIFG